LKRPDALRALLPAAGCVLLLAVGRGGGAGDDCGVPVVGKVTVDGEPLTAGAVQYVPDRRMSNTSTVRPGGWIDETGTYTLLAEGRPGVPPGWYTVVVLAFEPVVREATAARSLRVRGRPLVDPSYGRPETSSLQVEVTEAAPGAYDLNLKR